MENVICYWWYWLISAVISIFQGYRGFVGQRQMCEQQKIALLIETQSINANTDLIDDAKPALIDEQEKKFVIYAKTPRQILWLRAIPYCFFYFITTLLGFVALFFAYYILSNTCNLNDISGGTAALIIFAILYGIIGITGQLPYLIEQGKLPK